MVSFAPAGATLVVIVSPERSATPVNAAVDPVVVALEKEVQLLAVKAVGWGAATAGVSADAPRASPTAAPMALNFVNLVRMMGVLFAVGGGTVGVTLGRAGGTAHTILIRRSL
jgi:hypothetical protein